MKNLTTIGACAAFSMVAFTGAALADDHEGKGRMYVSGGIGYNMIDDVDVGGVSYEMDDGYSIIGALGYDTGDITSYGKFRIEAEVSYTENDNDSASAGGVTVPIGGTLEQTTVLVNGYVDFVPGGTLRPYLGIGLGFIDGDHSVSVGGFSGSGSGTEFAYRGAAGVTWHLDDNWGLDLGYRYTGWEASGDVDNHALVTSIRYTF